MDNHIQPSPIPGGVLEILIMVLFSHENEDTLAKMKTLVDENYDKSKKKAKINMKSNYLVEWKFECFFFFIMERMGSWVVWNYFKILEIY